MPRTLAALSAVLVLAGPASAQRGGRGDADAASYGWRTDYAAARAEAARAGKPLMVVFRCIP